MELKTTLWTFDVYHVEVKIVRKILNEEYTLISYSNDHVINEDYDKYTNTVRRRQTIYDLAPVLMKLSPNLTYDIHITYLTSMGKYTSWATFKTSPRVADIRQQILRILRWDYLLLLIHLIMDQMQRNSEVVPDDVMQTLSDIELKSEMLETFHKLNRIKLSKQRDRWITLLSDKMLHQDNAEQCIRFVLKEMQKIAE